MISMILVILVILVILPNSMILGIQDDHHPEQVPTLSRWEYALNALCISRVPVGTCSGVFRFGHPKLINA